MGEARAKSRALKALVAREPRCVYCEDLPTQIEHMPPRSLFRDKARPNGMEFACCATCNQGTSGADLVVSYVARLARRSEVGDWQTLENKARHSLLERYAPGFLNELFDDRKVRRTLDRTAGGVLVPAIEVQADGPLMRGYLTAFSTKLAMALFREHTGRALPSSGKIYLKWFLNAGLAEAEAHAMLSMLPAGGTLSQGAWSVPEQFAYRYNSDNKEIVAALAGFHSNLHIFLIAYSNPQYDAINWPTGFIVRPGDLLNLVPKPARSFDESVAP